MRSKRYEVSNIRYKIGRGGSDPSPSSSTSSSSSSLCQGGWGERLKMPRYNYFMDVMLKAVHANGYHIDLQPPDACNPIAYKNQQQCMFRRGSKCSREAFHIMNSSVCLSQYWCSTKPHWKDARKAERPIRPDVQVGSLYSSILKRFGVAPSSGIFPERFEDFDCTLRVEGHPKKPFRAIRVKTSVGEYAVLGQGSSCTPRVKRALIVVMGAWQTGFGLRRSFLSVADWLRAPSPIVRRSVVE